MNKNVAPMESSEEASEILVSSNQWSDSPQSNSSGRLVIDLCESEMPDESQVSARARALAPAQAMPRKRASSEDLNTIKKKARVGEACASTSSARASPLARSETDAHRESLVVAGLSVIRGLRDYAPPVYQFAPAEYAPLRASQVFLRRPRSLHALAPNQLYTFSCPEIPAPEPQPTLQHEEPEFSTAAEPELQYVIDCDQE